MNIDIVDKMVKARKEHLRLADLLEETSKERILLCNDQEKMGIQIYQGIDDLAEIVGAEIQIERKKDLTPRKVFTYKGVRFFQLGQINYDTAEVIFR